MTEIKMNHQAVDKIKDGFIKIHKNWINDGMPDSMFLYYRLSELLNSLVSEDEKYQTANEVLDEFGSWFVAINKLPVWSLGLSMYNLYKKWLDLKEEGEL